MLIYLRHGDDNHVDTYHHDRRLTKKGRSAARDRAAHLADSLGKPSVIYASPYRRAAETAEIMAEILSVPARLDPRLAQHLSERRQRSPDVSPETARACPIIESTGDFRQRVADHVAEVQRLTTVTWCVTHQVVIEAVGDLLGVDVPEDLDFLDYVVARSR